MKLNRQQLKKLIIKEYSKMVDEEKLINLSDLSSEDQRKFSRQSAYTYEKDVCEQCGSHMKEGESTCEQCGYNESSQLNESDCGCASNCDCRDIESGNDYSIDSMLSNHPLGDYSNLNNTNITPEQAFDAGYEVSAIDDDKMHHRKNNNYMAKPSLYKVAKYAQKLLHMIPDGYELDDWQRTKIAQISDDISEVYHSLDYDFYDED